MPRPLKVKLPNALPNGAKTDYPINISARVTPETFNALNIQREGQAMSTYIRGLLEKHTHTEASVHTIRYYITDHQSDGIEKEVSKAEFIDYEHAAGFYSGYPGEVATAGFSAPHLKGRIEYARDDQKSDE